MATIKALIRVTKGKDTANVRFRLSDGRSKQLFYTSSISVKVALWDSKKECISTRKVCNVEYRRTTNEEIQTLKERLLQVYEDNQQTIITSTDLKTAIDGIQKTSVTERGFKPNSMLFYIYGYIDENSNTLSVAYKRQYAFISHCIMRYSAIQNELFKACNFDNVQRITETDIKKFCNFFKDEYKSVPLFPMYYTKDFNKVRYLRVPKKERSANTISKILLCLHTIFKWMIRNNTLKKDPMSNYKIPNEVYGTPYFLTREERDYITNFDLSKYPSLEVARDGFILQCFIGCRYSDLRRLTEANVNNGFIEYVPQKTRKNNARLVRVPLHETAKRIIEKYKGSKDGLLLPLYPYVNRHNQKIREFFTLIGIKRSVVIFSTATRQEEHKPLNEVATSHLARRTFIGLLYKQIKDPCIISSMSGHAPNSKAFARYRTIDDEIKTETIKLL